MTHVTTIVVTDANVLINLLHVGRLSLLGRLTGYRFVVPDAVLAEVTLTDQQTQVTAALSAGTISLCQTTTMPELTLYAELRSVMGSGEAACLAIAVSNGWSVASDEKKRFRREVLTRLGPTQLLTTQEIYVLAIRAGVLTVSEADGDKAALAERRFVMKFGSFAEILQ